MTLKYFEDHKIASITAIIAVFSLVTKVLGLVRDMVFAHQFGTSSNLVGAYYAAFRLPDFIYNLLILGTFSVAFIPIYSEYLLKDKTEANKLASSIINMTLLAILLVSILAFIFIDPLVSMIVPGFTGESRELTKLFTKIFLFSPIFMTLSSIISSMLNTHKQFAIVAMTPALYNLSIIFGALVLYPWLGPKGIAFGVIGGSFLMFAFQLPQIFKTGFHYELIIKNSAGFIKFWKLYWPRIFSMGTEQITAIIVTIFGSYLGAQALAGFYYANNLQSVFLGIIAVSFAIAVFPLMSDLFNKKDSSGFKDVLAKTIVQILFFMIPLSIILLVLRAQAVRLIYGPGQSTNFNFDDTRAVAQALGLFCISLFAQSLIPLFTRAFYAMQNTRTPVIIGFATIACNIALSFYLIPRYGLSGMALAFSITTIINLSILIMELHRKLGNIHDEYLIINILKIVIAALFAGTAAFVTLYIVGPWVNMHTYLGVLIQAAAATIIAIGIYLAAGWIMGLSETHNLVKLLRTTGSKIGKPLNIIFNWWT